MKSACMLFVCIFFLGLQAFSQQEVQIKIVGNNNESILRVNSNIEELVIGKTTGMLPNIEKIEGIRQLENLKVLRLSFSDFSIFDFSFFDNLCITTLVLEFVYLKDLEFISRLKNIQKIIINEGVWIGDSVIDLKDNRQIQFIRIWGFNLDNIPVVKNAVSPMYLDIAWSIFKKIDLSNICSTVNYVINDEIVDNLLVRMSNIYSYSQAMQLEYYKNISNF